MRLSPELTPRGRRCVGSPLVDPPVSAAKRTPSRVAGGAGRNPGVRRALGGQRGSPDRPPPVQQDLTAARAARRGRVSSPSAGRMPGTAGAACRGSGGDRGENRGMSTPGSNQPAASARPSRQRAQRGRRNGAAAASDVLGRRLSLGGRLPECGTLDGGRSEWELSSSDDGRMEADAGSVREEDTVRPGSGATAAKGGRPGECASVSEVLSPVVSMDAGVGMPVLSRAVGGSVAGLSRGGVAAQGIPPGVGLVQGVSPPVTQAAAAGGAAWPIYCRHLWWVSAR